MVGVFRQSYPLSRLTSGPHRLADKCVQETKQMKHLRTDQIASDIALPPQTGTQTALCLLELLHILPTKLTGP